MELFCLDFQNSLYNQVELLDAAILVYKLL